MAESQYFITKCSLRPTGVSLDEEYSIVRGNPTINYFESIESPSISMTISFIDVDQVIGRKGITGGEYLNLIVKVSTGGGNNKEDPGEFKITDEHKMMLNSVTNLSTETNKQTATLEFVSVETIVNETARLNQKFSGNVSETVKKILKDDKKGIKTTKKLFGPKDEKLDETDDKSVVKKDRATNSYSFVGNLKRPFDTIQWLCPKAQSSKDDFGFLFFETLDGYHFRSIRKLLEQDAIEYRHTDKPDDFDQPFKILQNQVNQTNDIGMNCRMGMYANKTLYIDIENQELRIDDFNVNEDLKTNKPVKLPNELEKRPTRLMVRVSDFGVAQEGSERKKKQPLSELDVYQNKSYIRNNLLFSQSLSIAIPLNTNLRAGQVIKIKLPLKKDGENLEDSFYGDDDSNDPSGRYLISELRHLMGAGKSETQLTLVRDTYTVEPPDPSTSVQFGSVNLNINNPNNYTSFEESIL